mgnify:CR=1 FL=1
MIKSPYPCPCKGCDKRNAECHSNCQPYLEWVAKDREYKEAYSKLRESAGCVYTDAHEKFFKQVNLDRIRKRMRYHR